MSYTGPSVPLGGALPNSIPAGALQAGSVAYPNLDSTIYSLIHGKNRVINGSCRVAQRPSGAAYPNSAYGIVDRFLGSNSGQGQFSLTQGSITYGGISRPAVVATVTTAGTPTGANQYWGPINQGFEGYNVYDLVGQPMTLSFLFNTNVTGTYAASLRDSGSAYSFVHIFNATAGVPQKVVVPVPASTLITLPNGSSSVMGLCIGGISQTYGATTYDQWIAGNYFAGATVTNWAAAVNNFIAVAEVQLEAGNNPNPVFERLPYALEYEACRRYCMVFQGGVWLGPAAIMSASSAYVMFNGTQRLRANPTITHVGGTPKVYVNGGAVGFSSYGTMYFNLGTDLGGVFNASGATTVGQGGLFYSESAVIVLSAEL